VIEKHSQERVGPAERLKRAVLIAADRCITAAPSVILLSGTARQESMMTWSGVGLRSRMLVTGLAVGLVCLLGVTGCNSGAISAPEGGGGNASRGTSSDTDATSGGDSDDNSTRDGQSGDGGNAGDGDGGDGGNPGGDGPGRPKYKWQLPPGDTSPTGNEGSFYGNLRSCKGAKEDLSTETWWRGFLSPRNVLLYMAAAHLCLGDEAGGRRFYEEALSRYGTSGIGGDSRPCSVYRSVSSVLLQAAPESFSCPGGAAPQWQESQGGVRDNPLTFDVDESEPSSSPSDETTDDPTDGPTEDPTDESTKEPTDESTKEPTDESTKQASDEPAEEPTDGSTEGDGPTG
jgi:hypothetical protein